MQQPDKDNGCGNRDITLYDRFASNIFAYIYQQVSSPQDAEDLMVEVFMAALNHHNLARLPAEQQLAWLRRVAHNKVIDKYRHSLRFVLVPLEQIAETEDAALTPEERTIQRESYERLFHSLEQLSPVQQQLLQLRFGNGLRLAKIADILDASEHTVSKLLHRTLQRLRIIYEQKEKGNAR